MLKTISSITNAIGALNYKGAWNASTNTPTLASGVGTKGDYYVVSVAGSTNLDGETLWGVGDLAVFNGSIWQKVEGGNTVNATTITASTSVTTPIIQALNSAGGTLKNSGGTNQLQWGAGGGNNLSLEVATTINPANAAVAISPTGTGTVTINPATLSSMNNVTIGATTAAAVSSTNLSYTGTLTGGTGVINIGSGQVYKDASGNVGIGTSSPGYQLNTSKAGGAGDAGQLVRFTNTSTGNSLGPFHLTIGTTNYFALNAGVVLAGTNGIALAVGDGSDLANQRKLTIDSSGIVTMSAYGAGAANFSAAGVISSVSDETWKIKDGIPTNPDEMLQKLEPGYWFYNEEKAPVFGADRQLGFYAQNVNSAIGDEAAPIPEEGKPWGYYDRSVLAVTVMSLKNALNTIKEQQEIITQLQVDVAALKGAA